MNELESLEALLDELMQGIQNVLQSGEILSDEFQGILAEELGATFSRIEELKSQLANEPIPPEESQVQITPQTPPPPSAQLMWILAGQKVDAFINYLATYPDPQLQALLRNEGQLDSVIHQLMAMMPPGQPPTVNGIEQAGINSSNIFGFKYDPRSGRLLVRFQGGSVYGYNGVPKDVFKAFAQGAVPAKTNGQNQYGRWWRGKNPSLGASFYELIKSGGYSYNKIS